MKKRFAAFALAAGMALGAVAQDATVTVNARQGTHKIYKEIYGQFAEHLGSCIYGGLWVGEDSPIPNINGYRKDVFGALKDLDGRHRSAQPATQDAEQQLGRNH